MLFVMLFVMFVMSLKGEDKFGVWHLEVGDVGPLRDSDQVEQQN